MSVFDSVFSRWFLCKLILTLVGLSSEHSTALCGLFHSIVLAQSQKCQTERTALLCLSLPGWVWHSGCGTDGRHLHLSHFLYLLFGKQWLHYHRAVQLHSLAVSRAVCSLSLPACHSFFWIASNWILAGELIIRRAALTSSFIHLSITVVRLHWEAPTGFMPSRVSTFKIFLRHFSLYTNPQTVHLHFTVSPPPVTSQPPVTK